MIHNIHILKIYSNNLHPWWFLEIIEIVINKIFNTNFRFFYVPFHECWDIICAFKDICEKTNTNIYFGYLVECQDLNAPILIWAVLVLYYLYCIFSITRAKDDKIFYHFYIIARNTDMGFIYSNYIFNIIIQILGFLWQIIKLYILLDSLLKITKFLYNKFNIKIKFFECEDTLHLLDLKYKLNMAFFCFILSNISAYKMLFSQIALSDTDLYIINFNSFWCIEILTIAIILVILNKKYI